MRKNVNVFEDCTCDQFCHVKVYTERDEDCAEYVQISCRPYLRPVERTKDQTEHRKRNILFGIKHIY